eukprot:1158534-Pelagomonas_calceolata.AAC.2
MATHHPPPGQRHLRPSCTASQAAGDLPAFLAALPAHQAGPLVGRDGRGAGSRGQSGAGGAPGKAAGIRAGASKQREGTLVAH